MNEGMNERAPLLSMILKLWHQPCGRTLHQTISCHACLLLTALLKGTSSVMAASCQEDPKQFATKLKF